MASSSLRAALAWAATVATAVQALPDFRIMPLGDSITKGSCSSDGNGYRLHLREKLLDYATDPDFSVDMVGSLQHGNMTDNDHEGHSGEYLGNMTEFYKRSIGTHPNIVCLMAGTNNMHKEKDVDVAPALMEEIIDGIFEKSTETTILVAPIIFADNEAMNNRSEAFNKDLEKIVDKRQKYGKHILSVPIDIGKSDLCDMKHPNDEGYRKMGDAWFDAIVEADKREWLKPPVKVDKKNLTGQGVGYKGDGDLPDQTEDEDSASTMLMGSVWRTSLFITASYLIYGTVF